MQPLVIGTLLLNLSVFGVGVFLLYQGWRFYSFGSVIRNTPTAKPGSVAAGRAEVSGVAQHDGDPIEVPFLDEECVYMEWTLEERVDDEWEERAAEQRLDPFYLAGESGRVLVCVDQHPNPDELPWEYDSVRFDESERDRVDAFLADYRRTRGEGVRTDPSTTLDPASSDNPAVTSADEIDAGSDSSDRWRFVVRLLPPGTDLYVFGSIEPQYGRSDIGFEPDPSTGRFIINRSSEEQMTEGAYWLGLLTVSAGLLFMLWGGALATGQLSIGFL